MGKKQSAKKERKEILRILYEFKEDAVAHGRTAFNEAIVLADYGHVSEAEEAKQTVRQFASVVGALMQIIDLVEERATKN